MLIHEFQARNDKNVLEMGPAAQKVYTFILEHPEASKEDIVRGTGMNLEMVEKILYTFRARGLVSYRLLFHYEILPVGGAIGRN